MKFNSFSFLAVYSLLHPSLVSAKTNGGAHPTSAPTPSPVPAPTARQSPAPTANPTAIPTVTSTMLPTVAPSANPTDPRVTVAPTNEEGPFFHRISSFFSCSQLDPTCNVNQDTVAVQVAASDDGNTLVYTDSDLGRAWFVDITGDLKFEPVGLGFVEVGGVPTGVAICGGNAILPVDTTPDGSTTPSGIFHVVRVSDASVTRTSDLPGQPANLAVSPDCTRAVVAIENQSNSRDPQAPAGLLVVMDISNEDPSQWTLSEVDISDLGLENFSAFPEPVSVSINSDNIAVVTLQPNNAVVLINANDATIRASFEMGAADLDLIDTIEEGIIDQSNSLQEILREPDGVTWIGTDYFATADEGSLNGGSRGFTIFDALTGAIVYTSGNTVEHIAASIGHYPEERSGDKGSEPENVVFDVYDGLELLFVITERSGMVIVYDVSDVSSPTVYQILPAGLGPEGAVTIPQRNLLVVASEADDREDGYRSILNIYYKNFETLQYPTLVSNDRANGSPIPFSAISGLSASSDGQTIYAVDGSFYAVSRAFTIDISSEPPVVVSEHFISDIEGVLFGALDALGVGAALDDLVLEDDTVNLDIEGITTSVAGGFWAVHEGRGTPGVDFESPNLLLKLDDSFVIEDVFLLPDEVNDLQTDFGLTGVAENNEFIVVVFELPLAGEDNNRICVLNAFNRQWTCYFYEVDAVQSQNGGFVGISEISALGNNEYLLVERDNGAGPDAAVKRIYQIDLKSAPSPPDSAVLEKTLVQDLFGNLKSATYGPIVEKVDGMAVTPDGDVWIINNNDGLDDNSGEQLFLNVTKITFD